MSLAVSRGRPGRRLVTRLWALFTLVFIASYISISLVVLRDTSRYLVTHARHDLKVRAEGELISLKESLREDATNARAFAALDVMTDLAGDDMDHRVLRTLRELKRQDRLPGELYAFDSRDLLVASSARHWRRGLRMPSLWVAARRAGEVFVSKARNPFGRTSVVAFVSPVHASFAPGRRLGTIVYVRPWRSLRASVPTLPGPLLVYEGADPRHMLYHQRLPVTLPDPVREALSQGRQSFRLNGSVYWARYATGSPLAERHRAATGRSGDIVWTVVALTTARTVFVPLMEVFWKLMRLAVVIGLPLVFALFWLSRRFVQPIVALTHKALEVSESPDLTGPITATSDSEIGELEEAFNVMIARLRFTLDARAQATEALRIANASLESMAMTDSLTQLFNRRGAESRFIEEIATARRDGAGFAIAIGDIDHFKLLNDRFGHQVGDEALKQVAAGLRAELRPGDWVARWGGEEFLVFLRRADREGALIAIHRLHEGVRRAPFATEAGDIVITASFGIGVWSPDELTMDRVLAEADELLYEAKRRGRDCVVARPQAHPLHPLRQVSELQAALHENRVVPAYQIIVDLKRRVPVADEALARIHRPDGGYTEAGQFIEGAEEIHLIPLVDDVIARVSLTRCASRLRAGNVDPAFLHFINVSADFLARRDFVDRLLATAQELCATCGIADFGAWRPIVLEITERRPVGDFVLLRERLKPLLDFGFRVALDDFGSGYSSFLYLTEIPVHFLKIEAELVRQVVHDGPARRVIQSLVALAATFGLTTIAEGVESEVVAQTLADLGIHWAQGYHFGRPVCEDGTESPGAGPL